MQATSNQRGGKEPEAQIQGTRRGEGGDQVGTVQNRIPDLSFLCSPGQTSGTSTRLMLPWTKRRRNLRRRTMTDSAARRKKRRWRRILLNVRSMNSIQLLLLLLSHGYYQQFLAVVRIIVVVDDNGFRGQKKMRFQLSVIRFGCCSSCCWQWFQWAKLLLSTMGS